LRKREHERGRREEKISSYFGLSWASGWNSFIALLKMAKFLKCQKKQKERRKEIKSYENFYLYNTQNLQ
jgi:hypothetical protein